jgi:hypothetical protein
MKSRNMYIAFGDTVPFKKGELVRLHGGEQRYRVLRVYRNNWWRRLLRKWGLNVRINEIKVQ